MPPLTEKSLGIFWSGEEVDGITVYSFSKQPITRSSQPISNIWGDHAELKYSSLSGSDWVVWVCDIRILAWPVDIDWTSIIQSTLETITVQGALISWAAVEGCFAEPPNLFDPEIMGGCVWSIYSEEDGFYCAANLGEEMAYVDDEVIQKFKSRLRSLL